MDLQDKTFVGDRWPNNPQRQKFEQWMWIMDRDVTLEENHSYVDKAVDLLFQAWMRGYDEGKVELHESIFGDLEAPLQKFIDRWA